MISLIFVIDINSYEWDSQVREIEREKLPVCINPRISYLGIVYS